MSDVKLDTKAEFIAKFVLARASEDEYDSDWIEQAEEAWNKINQVDTKGSIIPFNLEVYLANKNMRAFTRNGSPVYLSYHPEVKPTLEQPVFGAIVYGEGTRSMGSWMEDGCYFKSRDQDDKDLVMREITPNWDAAERIDFDIKLLCHRHIGVFTKDNIQVEAQYIEMLDGQKVIGSINGSLARFCDDGTYFRADTSKHDLHMRILK